VIEATYQEVFNGVPADLIAFELVEGTTGGLAASGTFTAFIDGTTLRTVSDVQPGEVAEPVSVPGTGFLIMKVNTDKYRRARVVGRLPDNEPFSSGTLPPFGKSYQLATTKLYRKGAGGAFGGQVHVIDHSGETESASSIPLGILGDLTWRRAAWNRSTSFKRGIASRMPVEGLFYPVPGSRGLPEVFGISGTAATAVLTLSGGNLPAPAAENNQLSIGLRITSPNTIQVSEPNPLKMKVKANAKTAVFSGSFIHPTSRKTIRFNGAFQAGYGTALGGGRGCFLNGDTTGSVRFDFAP
jgi:hypothetical protein